MSLIRVTLAAMAVWRVTHLLQSEDGPFGILKRARGLVRRASASGFIDCFLCVSIWVAVPFGFALGRTSGEIILFTLALSAAAVLIDRAAGLSDGSVLHFEGENKAEEESLWPPEMVDMAPGDRRLPFGSSSRAA